MKFLTQLEVWQAMAKAYKHFSDTRVRGGHSKFLVDTTCGLCFATTALYRDERISEKTAIVIKKKIKKELVRKDCIDYLAAYTPEGAKVRVEFCKRMIKELKRNR